jgi:formylglycine-generating enzyme required for sulfatase activity
LNGKTGCTEDEVQTLYQSLFKEFEHVPSSLNILSWTDLCDRKPRLSAAPPDDRLPLQGIADAHSEQDQVCRRVDLTKLSDQFVEYRARRFKYLIAVRVAGQVEIFSFPSREARDSFIGDISVDPSVQYSTSEADELPPVEVGNTAGTWGEPTTLAPPAVARLVRAQETTNSIGMNFVIIPAGTFLMGSPFTDSDAEDHERPEHPITLSTPFYLAIHLVTQGQYRAITGQSPSKFKGSVDLPVEGVSWFSALGFCNALSRRENLPEFYDIVNWNPDDNAEPVYVPDWKGPGYRLPTEAEWEYSCRAGYTTRYPFRDERGLDEHAWYDRNSGEQTHPVGLKTPNAFGLYDMLGNVSEWCWDSYDPAYYVGSPKRDPRGPSWALTRVMRGGCWGSRGGLCRSAWRDWSAPDGWAYWLGFRVARTSYER